MKALIVYDSNFGNTKKVANEILAKLDMNARSIHVKEFRNNDLDEIELLIVGSPINAWRPTAGIMTFLKSLNPGRLKGIKVAAFDTRIQSWISGNAAKKIAKQLTDAGGQLIAAPVAFYVEGKEGPLLRTEIIKAGNWGKELYEKWKR